jgi:hypothetical protein
VPAAATTSTQMLIIRNPCHYEMEHWEVGEIRAAPAAPYDHHSG